MNWYKRNKNRGRNLVVLSSLAIEPWQYTAEELRKQLLFHGTIEPIEGDLHGGGYDDIVWTAESPSIAQNYISTGGYHAVSKPWNLKEPIRPTNHETFWMVVARNMGHNFDESTIEKDKYDRIQSYRLPEGWPTYQEAVDWIEGLGYNDDRGHYKIKSDIDGKILPPTYKPQGELFLAVGKDKLRIFDMTEGGKKEGDLMELDYNKLDLFKALESKGYDGVRINDFAQSDYWGNFGHHSIGLFPIGLKKIQFSRIPAKNFDWSDDEDRWTNMTPEFREWHKSEVMKAVSEGLPVPDEVKQEYGMASGGGL
jgi:hypothetical protein